MGCSKSWLDFGQSRFYNDPIEHTSYNTENFYLNLIHNFKVNVNPSYQPMELKYSLNKVGIKAIVSAESFKNLDYYSILNEVIPEIKETKPMDYVNSRHVPDLKIVIMISDNLNK